MTSNRHLACEIARRHNEEIADDAFADPSAPQAPAHPPTLEGPEEAPPEDAPVDPHTAALILALRSLHDPAEGGR
jgi:hypothetical protein